MGVGVRELALFRAGHGEDRGAALPFGCSARRVMAQGTPLRAANDVALDLDAALTDVATVEREWKVARAWLYARLKGKASRRGI